MEVKNSALCIFDRPAVQTDFVSNTIADYYPLTNVSTGGPFEFIIPGSNDEYIDVNDIQLYILAKVTKADIKSRYRHQIGRRQSGSQQFANQYTLSRCIPHY